MQTDKLALQEGWMATLPYIIDVHKLTWCTAGVPSIKPCKGWLIYAKPNLKSYTWWNAGLVTKHEVLSACNQMDTFKNTLTIKYHSKFYYHPSMVKKGQGNIVLSLQAYIAKLAIGKTTYYVHGQWLSLLLWNAQLWISTLTAWSCWWQLSLWDQWFWCQPSVSWLKIWSL